MVILGHTFYSFRTTGLFLYSMKISETYGFLMLAGGTEFIIESIPATCDLISGKE